MQLTPGPPDSLRTFSVDLGGTNLRVAEVSPRGKILSRRKQATPEEGRPSPVIATIVRLISALRSEHGQEAPFAVGVAAPGPLDPRTGIVHETPNLLGWHDYPFAEELGKALQAPVWVNNDANLAGLGEARFGAGRGFDPLIYLTVSTGIGGAIIQGGDIFEGAHGLAGELGHVVVRAGGPRCNFGHPGCLEGLASGTALAASARRLLSEGRRSSIPDHAEDAAGLTSLAVARAAADGDRLALELFDDLGRALGYGIGSFVNAFDPARVVVGGGVSQSWELFASAMREAADEVVMSRRTRQVEIVPAALGDDAGLVGAAAYALDCLRLDPGW